MENLYLSCLMNTVVEIEGASVVIRKGRKASTVPFSSISEVRLDEPHGFRRGSLWIFQKRGSTGFVGAGGVAVGLGGEIRVVFEASQLGNAKAIYKYITEYETITHANTAVSAADELRKFKELLDDGIITDEEFAEKKRQLLGF